jgi:hypothetical protein
VGALARYAEEGGPLVEPRAGELVRTHAERLSPLPYTDALGIARVEGAPAADAQGADARGAGAHAADAGGAAAQGAVAPGAETRLADGEARVRMSAWCAASTGYLAGLGEEALRLALEHARSRRAFGGQLTALGPVQQMLADAATLVDGLSLLATDSPGADALAHAGEASERAVAICMQVTGALGFTLEFPLQRAYRRSRAARVWADAVLLGWESPGR